MIASSAALFHLCIGLYFPLHVLLDSGIFNALKEKNIKKIQEKKGRRIQPNVDRF